ncbi:MAG: PIG-L deacetylase family protein [Alkalispirochaetaceae bacterium]
MKVTISRKDETGRVMRGGPSEVLPGWVDGERWLFVSPHDDDIAMAGALLVTAAVEAGVRVSCRIATDGRMGYTAREQRENIVAIRKEETLESFRTLGVEDVSWYDFPDADLYRHAGRRRATDGASPDVREGYTGLQNSLTWELRALRPHRVIALSGNDYHPDHKLLHQELLISLFHAQGAIWPELGAQLETVPPLYEIAAYCPFGGEPDYQLQGDGEAFGRKLESIGAYRSQRQIESLLKGIEESGPIEYMRTYPYELYRPARYAPLFRES